MQNKVSYEWDIEEVDRYDDIVDHSFADKLDTHSPSDLAATAETTFRLVAVRDVWNERDGVVDRQWAYPEGNKLPEYFQDAYQRDDAKTPKRLHEEFAAWLNKHEINQIPEPR